jgi:hypothetical protein
MCVISDDNTSHQHIQAEAGPAPPPHVLRSPGIRRRRPGHRGGVQYLALDHQAGPLMEQWLHCKLRSMTQTGRQLRSCWPSRPVCAWLRRIAAGNRVCRVGRVRWVQGPGLHWLAVLPTCAETRGRDHLLK